MFAPPWRRARSSGRPRSNPAGTRRPAIAQVEGLERRDLLAGSVLPSPTGEAAVAVVTTPTPAPMTHAQDQTSIGRDHARRVAEPTVAAVHHVAKTTRRVVAVHPSAKPARATHAEGHKVTVPVRSPRDLPGKSRTPKPGITSASGSRTTG